MDDPARIRTWNLLIRSQTRYPLRHRTACYARGGTDARAVVYAAGRARAAKEPNVWRGCHEGGVAQMVERSLSMREVRGSIPRTSTMF